MTTQQHELFKAFLPLHGKQAKPSDAPLAYLQFASAYRGVPSRLITFRREDVVAEFDSDAPLVRWLLNQMTTYDCRTQRIVGLVFDRRTILSEVVR